MIVKFNRYKSPSEKIPPSFEKVSITAIPAHQYHPGKSFLRVKFKYWMTLHDSASTISGVKSSWTIPKIWHPAWLFWVTVVLPHLAVSAEQHLVEIQCCTASALLCWYVHSCTISGQLVSIHPCACLSRVPWRPPQCGVVPPLDRAPPAEDPVLRRLEDGLDAKRPRRRRRVDRRQVAVVLARRRRLLVPARG